MGSIFKIFILLTMLTSCTSVIYQPDRYLHADPHAFGINFKEYYVRSYDGTRLLVWELKSKTPHPENLVLMFHGNAENLSSHVFNLAWMVDKNTDVMIFDYRGYGLSEGSPSPKGVLEDGMRMLQIAGDKYLAEGYKHLIVYAQSLGGAIALRALEEISWRSKISLLVLDSTFRSPQDVARTKLHGLFWWLISSEFTADERLSHLTMPLLVIHSKNDPVIPFKLGEDIFNKAPSKNKTFWKLDEPDAGHGNVFFIDKGKYREEFFKLLH
jgi:alpha-beta hydrolase superfamily lysophospholipase